MAKPIAAMAPKAILAMRTMPNLALCVVHLVGRGFESARQLDGIVVCPEMHEEQARLVIQHVIVDCRHLDAVLPNGAKHRIDHRSDQYEVAGDRRLAVAGRRDVDRDAGAIETGMAIAPSVSVSPRGIAN